MVQLSKSSSVPKFVALMVPALVQGRSVTLLRRAATTNATCGSQFSWMDNSSGQSPCLLASILTGACSTGNWNVPPVNSTQLYNPPTVSYANYCSCSWAVYNLLGACTACQDNDNIVDWDPYISNCANYLTNTAFPTNRIIPPNNTLLPYWAAINPTTWTDGQFDVAQAQSINASNHPNINLSNPTSSNKKSSSTGAIVGGVVGGVVGAILIVAVIFLYLRRRRRKSRRPRKLLDPHPTTKVHERSMSDTSQKTSDRTILPDRYSATPSTMYTTIAPTSPNGQTNFGPTNHDLPYDVSLITNMSNSPSPPPQSSVARMSVQSGANGTAMEPENVITPFTLTTTMGPVDRKRPDAAMYPIYEEPNAIPSSRRRLNPPTYNETVNTENGESSLLSYSPVDRKRRAHEPQNSVDSMNSMNSTTTTTTTTPGNRDSIANSEMSLRTQMPPGSVSGIDDAMTQLGFRASSVVAAGSTAMSSSLGARRATVLTTDGSVLDANEVA